MQDLEEALAALRRQAGIGFADVHRLLCRVASAPGWKLGDLVEDTGIPHRRVMEILHRLGLDARAGALELTEEQRREIQSQLGCDDRPAGFAEEEGVAATVEEVAAGLPPSLWDLDHVPATTATILARARYLAGNYALPGAHLVCLGDHDLTSVATKLLVPEATVSVVDIDERLLEYLDGVSDRLGLGLRLRAADLRLSLPRDLEVQGDAVFCDPPYSREGVDLFVRRGVEALAERPGAALVFCYGVGDRGAEQLLAVQEALAELHIVLTALLPGFNRYRGAHAIGARSALWVCRPTRRTRPAVAAVESRDARIYSRGRASRESVVGAMPREVRAVIDREGPSTPVSPAELIRAATDPPHQGARRRWPTTMLVDLGRFYTASIGKVLMAAPPGSRLLVVGERRALVAARSDPLRRLLQARFEVEILLEAKEANHDNPGVVSATPVDTEAEGDGVLRYLQEHQAAKLRNAWREALIAAASRQGQTMTKNQARALIDASPMTPAELDAHLLDLPLHSLGQLIEAVEQTLASGLGGRAEVEGGGTLLGATQQRDFQGGAGG